MQGVCTHVSDVKPHIVVATYTDSETGFEIYQQVTGMHLTTFCLLAVPTPQLEYSLTLTLTTMLAPVHFSQSEQSCETVLEHIQSNGACAQYPS